MNHGLTLLFIITLLSVNPAKNALAESSQHSEKNCRSHIPKRDCETGSVDCKNGDGTCSPEMRGRCGKRRGDWYGASQPVTDPAEARKQLTNYYAEQGYKVSEVIEKKWGFRADILDKDGKVVDRAMIDKRSGRIRSIY